jgi:two-component system chemotaxis sensor kinase CheA
MVVESGGERFVIPQVSLVELVRLEEEQARERIERIHGAPVCRLRGKLLPLVHLNRILSLSPEGETGGTGEVTSIVVLQAEDRQFGLVVDGIRDTQEIVVKPLGKQLKGVAAYSGATVMGDGRVVLILDVPGIAQLAGFSAAGYANELRTGAGSASEDNKAADRHAVLLFRSPGCARMAVPLALVARLEEFPRERLEYSGGRRVIQYRDRILALTSLDQVLGSAPGIDEGVDPLQVIVFMNGEQGLGLVVGEILDIVEDTVHIRKSSRREGVLGSAVVGGQVTDFLDLEAVLRASGEHWLEGARRRAATVLVAGNSAFARAMVRASVEMAGHRVIECANQHELIDGIEKRRVDMIALASDADQAAGQGSLLALIRQHSNRSIPVLTLGTGRPESTEPADAHAESFSKEDIANSIQALLNGA